MFVAAFFSLSMNAAHASMITGTSFDRSSLKVQYIEQHQHNSMNKTTTVAYLSPDNRLLAYKELLFTKAGFCPSFEIYFAHNKRSVGITPKNEEILLFTREENGKQNQKAIPNVFKTGESDTLVCDAGFDNFVREQISGKTYIAEHSFYFALPNHLTLLKMNIREIKPPDLDSKTRKFKEMNCSQCEENDFRYFIIEPENWLYRKLTSPVTLVYHKNQLLIFSGRSNIASKQHGITDVIIFYEYSKQTHAPSH